jgi:ATP-dependent protease Clp ATPase subunit
MAQLLIETLGLGIIKQCMDVFVTRVGQLVSKQDKHKLQNILEVIVLEDTVHLEMIRGLWGSMKLIAQVKWLLVGLGWEDQATNVMSTVPTEELVIMLMVPALAMRVSMVKIVDSCQSVLPKR